MDVYELRRNLTIV